MIAVMAFTRRGRDIGEKLASGLSGRLYTYYKYAGDEEAFSDVNKLTQALFPQSEALIFVGAAGIAVRSVAPFLKSKLTDPAVVSVDEAGRFSVPLVSGHLGGANRLAQKIAALCGGTAVISTATDLNGVFAVDVFAADNGLLLTNKTLAKEISAALLNGEEAGFVSEYPADGELPKGLTASGAKLGIYVGADSRKRPFMRTLQLSPKNLVLGVGCKKGTSAEAAENHLRQTLEENGLRLEAVCALCSVELKRGEPALSLLAEKYGWALSFYSAGDLQSLPGTFSGSDFVREVAGTDNVCERSAVAGSGGGRLLVKKTAGNGITVAVAEKNTGIAFGGDFSGCEF